MTQPNRIQPGDVDERRIIAADRRLPILVQPPLESLSDRVAQASEG